MSNPENGYPAPGQPIPPAPDFGILPAPPAGPARLFRWFDLLWLILIVALGQFVPGVIVGLIAAFSGTASVQGGVASVPPMLIMAAVAGSGVAMLVGGEILRNGRGMSRHAVGFRAASWKPLLAAVIVFVVYIGICENLSRLLGIDPEGAMARELLVDFVPEGASTLHILLAFAGIGLFVPLAEEYIFRGILVTWLRERVGAIAAVILSALGFATIHFYFLITEFGFGMYITGQIFVLGLLLAWLYVWSRSLWPSILLHAVNNMMAIAIVVWGG
jgi:membrane protease YdiL (CAAX protease family)